mmetsp:Transcript_59920/g.112766  ORF Transcript_59920/g.112766 Transcript_59920/m.112766 type:complete len:261 (-) Transcript_59920:88-870(-)
MGYMDGAMTRGSLSEKDLQEVRKHMDETAKDQTAFEQSFAVILKQLAQEYSVLRMGAHQQLIYRILLDRATGYMDTVKLYSSAIHVLQYRLKDPQVQNKDLLIGKITHAKLQLETLVRMVEPFIEQVLHKLVATGISAAEESVKGDLSARICRTHLIDIENNLKSFLEIARTQIELCSLSITQYDREVADKSNAILNFLTIITFLVMPVQIITSWYGMNFLHMPELKWNYGYHYCLLLIVVLFTVFASVLGCVSGYTSRQ